MEQAMGFGLVGLFFLVFAWVGLFGAVLLAILWEQDRWMFQDVPWYGMLIVWPLWFVMTICYGIWDDLTHGC